MLHGKLAHGLKGCLVIQVAVFVNPDDIESIAELHIRRVLGMMRVHEPILFYLHAGHAAGHNQVIAVLVIRRLIDIRKKSVQRFGNGKIDTVEKAHRSILRQRVLDPLLRDLVGLALAGRGRKPRRIFPFRMRR